MDEMTEVQSPTEKIIALIAVTKIALDVCLLSVPIRTLAPTYSV